MLNKAFKLQQSFKLGVYGLFHHMVSHGSVYSVSLLKSVQCCPVLWFCFIHRGFTLLLHTVIMLSFQVLKFKTIIETLKKKAITYTEHQKKLITSSERCSLKSTASKLIIFWTQINYSSPYEAHLKSQGLLLPKRRKIWWNNFSKITETSPWEHPRKAAYSEHSIAIHSISMVGCVTAVPAFVCVELRGRETSSFCDFWKVTACDVNSFYSFFTQPNVCFLDVLGKEYYS